MTKKVIAGILSFLFFSYSLSCADDLQEGYSASKSSSIFQPKNDSFRSKTSESVRAKVDCNEITVDININTFLNKLENALTAVIGNINVLILNGTIGTGAYLYAYNTCFQNLMTYAAEHPEQAAKIQACISESTDIPVSTGGQSGMWFPPGSVVSLPWVNLTFKTSNNPGVTSKIMGCITGELGDEMGNSFRRCVDFEYQNTLLYIRKLLTVALEEDFRFQAISRQQCILDQKLADNDISVGLGVKVMPDGTKVEGRAGGAFVNKIAYSTYTPNRDEMSLIFQNIDGYFEGLVTENTRLQEEDIDELLNWYKGFRKGSWKKAEYVCMETLESPDNTNYESYQIKLNICSRYIEDIYDLMVSKALGSPLIAASTKIERRLATNSYHKLHANIKQELQRYKNLLERIEAIDMQQSQY